MENSNCAGRNPKTIPSGNVVPCPWVSRYPILQQAVYLGDGQPYFRPHCGTVGDENSNFHGHIFPNQAGLHQQSSNHFFQFLRLTQLFPDIHPATLHTVSILCKNDFFCTVDKLLYAKRCKQLNAMNKTSTEQGTSKNSRYQPYCATKSGKCDVTVPNEENVVEVGKAGDKKEKTGEGNGGKLETHEGLKVDKLSSGGAADLFLFASPKCKLPIRPLSPINNPEDLTNPSVSQSPESIE